MAYEEITTKILGEHTEREGEVASLVLSYVSKNPDWERKEKETYNSKTSQAINDALVEIYGHGLSYYLVRNRAQDRVMVRGFLCLLYREITPLSLTLIGDTLGLHHSTVLWNIRRTQSDIKIYRAIGEEYNKLKITVQSKL